MNKKERENQTNKQAIGAAQKRRGILSKRLLLIEGMEQNLGLTVVVVVIF